MIEHISITVGSFWVHGASSCRNVRCAAAVSKKGSPLRCDRRPSIVYRYVPGGNTGTIAATGTSTATGTTPHSDKCSFFPSGPNDFAGTIAGNRYYRGISTVLSHYLIILDTDVPAQLAADACFVSDRTLRLGISATTHRTTTSSGG